MQLVLIGLGEVGRCYAERLHATGFDLVLCEPSPSSSATEIAKSRHITIHPTIGPWLDSADWILSCVTGSQATAVASACCSYMREGARLVDMTTASPSLNLDAESNWGSIRHVPE